MDWSPDGKWIATVMDRKDGTKQIGLVGVQDGSVRVLKSMDWRGPTSVFFSPDGHDLALDLPVTDDSGQRDVFVLAVDGSREVQAVVHPSNDVSMGWSPDGKHLLFASDRNGSTDLWTLSFSEGRPQGVAELVKANIGNAWSLGVTDTGALYMGVRAGNRDIELASIDLNTGKQIAPPIKPIQRFTGSNEQPAWSPDGKSLAYVSARGADGHVVIAIRSLDTGETRELQTRPVLPWFVGLSWAPDGRSFAVNGRDLKGRRGVFRVDATTGQVIPIVLPLPEGEFLSYEGFSWSPDGRHLYYHYQLPKGTIHERDLVSGSERIVASGVTPISLSPDGRWIATSRRDTSTNSQLALLIPVDGGEPRELLRVVAPQSVAPVTWTPDSRAVLLKKRLGDAQSELWLASTTGAAPRKVEFDANRVYAAAQGWIRLHPDGRQLAFVSGQRASEVWVLENFLPAPSAKK
jgi:Tol biopolymer transport system component